MTLDMVRPAAVHSNCCVAEPRDLVVIQGSLDLIDPKRSN